jgi:hypothetical protein
LILQVAERFGQLPDTVENEMSEYWFDKAVVLIHGESLDNQRRIKEARRK